MIGAIISSAFKKAFLTGYYFTIAIREKNADPILEDVAFRAKNVIPASVKEWCADPMLAEDSGKTYLFYEAVSGQHGRIEVREILDECTLSSPTVLFDGDNHYSYPFVFKKETSWYMIPETSDQGEVQLYRSVRFPYKWEKAKTLMIGSYVDTTVFKYNDIWILLTFETTDTSEKVILRAFRLLWNDDGVSAEPMECTNYDPLCVRGAGPVFKCGDSYVRPVQVSTDTRYGDSVAFHEIDIIENAYSEIPRGQLLPERIFCKKRFVDGLHTYSECERYEAIDIRCRDFDCLKPIKKIFKKLVGTLR